MEIRHLTDAPATPPSHDADHASPVRRLLGRAGRRTERGRMFAAVRHYADVDPSLLDDLASRGDAIRRAIVSVPGAVGCELIRTREGLIVLISGQDEASVAEAGRRFVAWLAGNVPALRVATPAVWAGPVLAPDAAPSVAGNAGLTR